MFPALAFSRAFSVPFALALSLFRPHRLFTDDFAFFALPGAAGGVSFTGFLVGQKMSS